MTFADHFFGAFFADFAAVRFAAFLGALDFFAVFDPDVLMHRQVENSCHTAIANDLL